jgi:hypothetical protein
MCLLLRILLQEPQSEVQAADQHLEVALEMNAITTLCQIQAPALILVPVLIPAAAPLPAAAATPQVLVT